MPLQFQQFLTGERMAFWISGFQGKLLTGFHKFWRRFWRRFKEEFASYTIAVDDTIKVTGREWNLCQENRVVGSMFLCGLPIPLNLKLCLVVVIVERAKSKDTRSPHSMNGWPETDQVETGVSWLGRIVRVSENF
jgi:hypothetical protein